MKVKMLDQPIVLIDRFNNKTETVWYEVPLTIEEACTENDRVELLLDQVKNSSSDQAAVIINTLVSMKPAKKNEGKPWTIRQAVISAMYAVQYKHMEKDKQGNSKWEKEDVIAQMAAIGHAFQHAKTMGYVELDASDITLVRRKMYELPVPRVVSGEVNRYFDQLEGTRKRTIHYGVDDEDKGETDNGQDDAVEASDES